MAAEAELSCRFRRAGARALRVAGGLAIEASTRLVVGDGGTDLRGDRTVEWSFCLGRLSDGPGATLDFGADAGFLALASAQRGHEVVALDRMPNALDYGHERVTFLQADILERPLEGRLFDQILNCSSIEHVGLAGRYGSIAAADGDLEAMAIMRERLAPHGRMLMTIPVGRDRVCAPFHRIYGTDRLSLLLEAYRIEEEQYWRKDEGTWRWIHCSREIALATEGSETFYSLGLFALSGR